MKITILAVGNKMPDWIETGCAEYAKRLPKELAIKLIDIKPEKKANTEQRLFLERTRITAAIPPGWRTIALDEHGKQWSSIKFAKVMTDWLEEGGNVAFIIGGADGLHRDIKERAHETLALSSMTLPHGLVRVLLIEQLYRAVSIIKRHPYHRG